MTSADDRRSRPGPLFWLAVGAFVAGTAFWLVLVRRMRAQFRAVPVRPLPEPMPHPMPEALPEPLPEALPEVEE